MRMFLSVALAAAIFTSNALAKDAATPLAPGKPAGVKEAQSEGVNTIAILGLAALAGIAVIASSRSSHHNGGTSSSATTTGTSP